jgi:hypothetical protein
MILMGKGERESQAVRIAGLRDQIEMRAKSDVLRI